MIEALQSFDFTPQMWALAILCGLLIGMTKTGLFGAAMFVVPVLAGMVGGKASVGLLLPMLCVGDVFGVAYYNRHAQWTYIWRLMPWVLIGIAIALYVGKSVSDAQFNRILAVAILSSVGILIWRETRRDGFVVPAYWWFSALMGLAGGFTTMIGNAAGPVMILYFLSMGFGKYTFIGTQVWFFMIVNLLKVPLHIFFWHTITVRTLYFDLVMIPLIAIGAFLGVRIVRFIPEKPYKYFILTMTVIAAIKLIVG